MIVDDNKIIDLYFARDERAIKQTKAKYGKLLFGISYGILHSVPDAEECVDDTYMSAWGAIPPAKPTYFSAFLSKIVRNISFNRYNQNKRRTRNLVAEAVLDELAECIPAPAGEMAEDIAIRDCLNRFLSGLSSQNRIIFVKRYFFMRSIGEISDETGVSISAVKVALSRMRALLKERLEREDIYL
jgi:RNA polymerase sigma-70 factor (ECF subfamily)